MSNPIITEVNFIPYPETTGLQLKGPDIEINIVPENCFNTHSLAKVDMSPGYAGIPCQFTIQELMQAMHSLRKNK